MIIGAVLIVGASMIFAAVMAWIISTLDEIGGRDDNNNRQRQRKKDNR